MANNETARLAVLIDAGNASASVVKELLQEVVNTARLPASAQMATGRPISSTGRKNT